ncbi:LOW QUALITY PROTEIN: epidermal growth factor-like protein 7 [Spea bombifrons]|uniref:LOW QUALITY PROTEIN: epidermal growth factor-like protein 7 n=1 Tax=Spea bombifrons TaxID=233779 RepID=UPI00234A10F2|nr:LOW QUALITY PROTEIN: epidermal growth factor-like protein 7 [Spea bombifrons]
MWGVSCWLAGFALLLGASGTDHFYRPGRRICSYPGQDRTVSVTQSFVQPVYRPLMTLCEGHKLCSTYRTTYRISYRQVSKKTSSSVYSCCHGCNKASCRLLCQNGGVCTGLNKCRCPAGWTGLQCQTDVEECEGGSHRCSQACINTPGSFRCQCLEGFTLSEDGRSCFKVENPTELPPETQPPANASAVPDTTSKEIEELRNKVEILEQKLQMVLAPFHALSGSGPSDGSDAVAFLTHSIQQLERIDSLSEQISFLEERLETCSCKNEL